tara:strand:+ start:1342 stop:1497 length:156 start_codon:yes stop_codon:yes gene_type:complete
MEEVRLTYKVKKYRKQYVVVIEAKSFDSLNEAKEFIESVGFEEYHDYERVH